MTNLLVSILTLTATNTVEFRTNVIESPVGETLYLFDPKTTNLVPLVKRVVTNVWEITTLDFEWKGQHQRAAHQTNVLSTTNTLKLNLNTLKWKEVKE